MQLEHKTEGSSLVVRVREKRLDARGAQDFKQQVRRLIDDGNRRVILDLADVEFVDSSGLGAIVSILKLLAGSGELALAGAQETVLTMLRVTRLDKVFQIYPDAASAVTGVAVRQVA